MRFSVIIPVYNRPDEIEGLLHSFTEQSYSDYSIIIVEDGSSVPCDAVVESYSRRLPIEYLTKANGGPASARNYGARYAKGEYLIFLDSDTTIPAGYFEAIESYLVKNEVDLFGGPDRSDDSFTPLQRAISYSLTSFFTTGGIRGGKKKITRFIPRSFNMGVRRSVFEEVSGFAPMRFGEDMDLSMRILESGHSSALIDDAFVYHKRRTSLRGFYRQVFHSGCARIDLSIRHKGSLKLVHLLPLCFILGCLALVLCAAIFRCAFIAAPILLYALLLFVDSSIKEKSPYVGLLSVAAAFVQLFAYGLGFIDNLWKRCILKKASVSNIDNDRFYS